MSTSCPRCGEHRVGSFRFCRNCSYDFDRQARTTAPAAFGKPAHEFQPFDLFPRPDGSTRQGRPSKFRVAAAIAVVIISIVLAVGVAARSLGLL